MNKTNKYDLLPYEKFLQFGPGVLTDAELLAIILRTGTKGKSAYDIATQVLGLGTYPREGLLGLYDISLEELMKISGIGEVKAVKIKCLSELSMRMHLATAKIGFCVNEPASVAEYCMEKLRHLPTETVILLSLDSKGLILGEDKIFVGSVKMSMVSPREIFLTALNRKAVNLIMVHNHPSGDPTPSRADIDITSRIYGICKEIDIPLLDHIIIGDNRYISLKQQGYL